MIEMIRQGGESAQRGMEMLYQDESLRKHAWYFHSRYGRYAETNSWEDLLTEAFVRIVVEIEEERGPNTGNCWGYFRNVCRNICEEFIREDEKNLNLVESLAGLYNAGANIVRDGVECCLKMLGGKCESLLRYYYMQDPPVKDYQELSDLLKEEGFGDFKPGAMHAHLHQCRRKFEIIMKNNPNCFNL